MGYQQDFVFCASIDQLEKLVDKQSHKRGEDSTQSFKDVSSSI
jgi:hypothetical protein